MAKKISDLTDGLMSIVKVAPLIGGAAYGLVVNDHEGHAPLTDLIKGDWHSAILSTAENYAFIDSSGTFHSEDGKGAKGLAAGMIAHKVLNWLM